MFDTKSEMQPVCRIDHYNLKLALRPVTGSILCLYFCFVFYCLLTALSPPLSENKLNNSFSSLSNASYCRIKLKSYTRRAYKFPAM